MTYPVFRKGIEDAAPSLAAVDVPPLAERQRADRPDGYEPHKDLSDAVNVAVILGMPLLLTGEPGTGKTQLAYSVGHEMKCPVHKFETKSTSISRDLFYTYDAMAAFKAQNKELPQSSFIRYQALGRAILEAFPADHPRVAPLVDGQKGYEHKGPRRAVVLIDEVDKAPRDFPNDLLNEMERLYFRVPELHNAGSPGAEETDERMADKYRPIVILTSNSEKGLPDAFLRRCIYFDIPFPNEEQMKRIVAQRIGGFGDNDPLLVSALDLFYDLRNKDSVSLAKKPSTAELLNWLQILRYRKADPRRSLQEQQRIVLETLSTLVKNTADRKAAADYAKSWAPTGG